MPLLDHFHPPLSVERHWHAFHNTWATFIAAALNKVLPEHYFAEPNVQFGIEIDVATFEHRKSSRVLTTAGWTPPAPALSLPMNLLTDVVEVHIMENSGGPELSAAIELVSPSNKDRPASRDAFVNKCAAYLQRGIGLVVIDIVTERSANLHDALLERVAGASPARGGSVLYAAAYRPAAENESEATTLEVWIESLAVGAPLPTLPLWARGDLWIPLLLEESYAASCDAQRLSR